MKQYNRFFGNFETGCHSEACRLFSDLVEWILELMGKYETPSHGLQIKKRYLYASDISLLEIFPDYLEQEDEL